MAIMDDSVIDDPADHWPAEIGLAPNFQTGSYPHVSQPGAAGAEVVDPPDATLRTTPPVEWEGAGLGNI